MEKFRRGCSIFFAAMLLLVWSSTAYETFQAESSASPKKFECSESPRENLLNVIAPMAGANPVWMVDSAYGIWQGGDKPVKTAWVVARGRAGDLRVTGRRLDGEGRTRFKKGVDAPVMEELIISNAHRGGVIPGGASSEIIREYAFHPSYVIYPSPGCWELVARAGGDEVRIIINMKDARR